MTCTYVAVTWNTDATPILSQLCYWVRRDGELRRAFARGFFVPLPRFVFLTARLIVRSRLGWVLIISIAYSVPPRRNVFRCAYFRASDGSPPGGTILD